MKKLLTFITLILSFSSFAGAGSLQERLHKAEETLEQFCRSLSPNSEIQSKCIDFSVRQALANAKLNDEIYDLKKEIELLKH